MEVSQEVKVTKLERRLGRVLLPETEIEPKNKEQAKNKAITDGCIRGLAKLASEIFLLEWQGNRVPRGAIVGDKTIGWTQHGQVKDNTGKDVGVYMRIVEFGGVSGQEQKMIVFMD